MYRLEGSPSSCLVMASLASSVVSSWLQRGAGGIRQQSLGGVSGPPFVKPPSSVAGSSALEAWLCPRRVLPRIPVLCFVPPCPCRVPSGGCVLLQDMRRTWLIVTTGRRRQGVGASFTARSGRCCPQWHCRRRPSPVCVRVCVLSPLSASTSCIFVWGRRSLGAASADVCRPARRRDLVHLVLVC